MRHMTHGMIKYRGSTRGAVISESAVASSNMRLVEVDTGSAETRSGSSLRAA
jgi:hypothetical protein